MIGLLWKIETTNITGEVATAVSKAGDVLGQGPNTIQVNINAPADLLAAAQETGLTVQQRPYTQQGYILVGVRDVR